MRKPDFCICENKDADQLGGNREADQRLCFHYTDSDCTARFVSTWSETPKTGFLRTRLISVEVQIGKSV